MSAPALKAGNKGQSIQGAYFEPSEASFRKLSDALGNAAQKLLLLEGNSSQFNAERAKALDWIDSVRNGNSTPEFLAKGGKIYMPAKGESIISAIRQFLSGVQGAKIEANVKNPSEFNPVKYYDLVLSLSPQGMEKIRSMQKDPFSLQAFSLAQMPELSENAKKHIRKSMESENDEIRNEIWNGKAKEKGQDYEAQFMPLMQTINNSMDKITGSHYALLGHISKDVITGKNIVFSEGLLGIYKAGIKQAQGKSIGDILDTFEVTGLRKAMEECSGNLAELEYSKKILIEYLKGNPDNCSSLPKKIESYSNAYAKYVSSLHDLELMAKKYDHEGVMENTLGAIHAAMDAAMVVSVYSGVGALGSFVGSAGSMGIGASLRLVGENVAKNLMGILYSSIGFAALETVGSKVEVSDLNMAMEAFENDQQWAIAEMRKALRVALALSPEGKQYKEMEKALMSAEAKLGEMEKRLEAKESISFAEAATTFATIFAIGMVFSAAHGAKEANVLSKRLKWNKVGKLDEWAKGLETVKSGQDEKTGEEKILQAEKTDFESMQKGCNALGLIIKKSGNNMVAISENEYSPVAAEIPTERLAEFMRQLWIYKNDNPDLHRPDGTVWDTRLLSMDNSYASWAVKNLGRDIVDFFKYLNENQIPHDISRYWDRIASAIEGDLGLKIKNMPRQRLAGSKVVYEIMTDKEALIVKIKDMKTEAAALRILRMLGFEPGYSIGAYDGFGIITKLDATTYNKFVEMGSPHGYNYSNVLERDSPERINFLCNLTEALLYSWITKLEDSHDGNFMVGAMQKVFRIDMEGFLLDTPNTLYGANQQLNFVGRNSEVLSDRLRPKNELWADFSEKEVEAMRERFDNTFAKIQVAYRANRNSINAECAPFSLEHIVVLQALDLNILNTTASEHWNEFMFSTRVYR